MVKFVKVDPSTIKTNPELVINLKPREGLISNINRKNFLGIWRQELIASLMKSPFLVPAKILFGTTLCKIISHNHV